MLFDANTRGAGDARKLAERENFMFALIVIASNGIMVEVLTLFFFIFFHHMYRGTERSKTFASITISRTGSGVLDCKIMPAIHTHEIDCGKNRVMLCTRYITCLTTNRSERGASRLARDFFFHLRIGGNVGKCA